MNHAKWWQQASAQGRSCGTLQRTLIITAMLFCVGLEFCSYPAQAGNPIDPKLREQVLQIIRENPEVVLESVRAYQRKQQQAQENARQAFVAQLQKNPRGLIGSSPTKGAKMGKVLLVEFSDFQCPYCAQASGTLKEFIAKHQDTVTLVYKHFPLSKHPEALPAARAAWAAGQQGKFWDYHDALFQNQEKLGEAFYTATATVLKLDLPRFNRDRASAAANAAIESDQQMAEKVGVDATPFFVMNGVTFSGALPLSDLEELLAKVPQ
jgi:protein-disulfide isomerase